MQFFKAALRKNLSPSYVKDDLVQLGECVVSVYKKRLVIGFSLVSTGLSEEKSDYVSKQVISTFFSYHQVMYCSLVS